MAKIISITEHFQHFLAEMKESFWGDVYGQTTVVWKQLLEADSRQQRDRYAVRELYQPRRSRRQPYRNGYYERDFVTRFGTIRLRVARTRGKSFLPCGIEPFQRRAEEVALLIREAFLRGISTRQAGRGRPGFSGGDSHGLSAGPTSALLGAQDAQPSGESTEALRRGEDGRPGDVPGPKPGAGGSGVSRVPGAVAPGVRADGAATRTRLAGTAVVLCFSPAPVAETAHHQRDRALLRGGAPTNPAHGVLCECRKCGPHHLLHLPEIQSGMENPHPLHIYTSSLTSP